MSRPEVLLGTPAITEQSGRAPPGPPRARHPGRPAWLLPQASASLRSYALAGSPSRTLTLSASVSVSLSASIPLPPSSARNFGKVGCRLLCSLPLYRFGGRRTKEPEALRRLLAQPPSNVAASVVCSCAVEAAHVSQRPPPRPAARGSSQVQGLW